MVEIFELWSCGYDAPRDSRSSASISKCDRRRSSGCAPCLHQHTEDGQYVGGPDAAKRLLGQPVLYLPLGGADRDRILRMPDEAFHRFGVYRGFFDIALARERVPNPFIFTFLRNPEERLVSDLYYGSAKRGAEFSFENWNPDDCNLMTRMLAGSASAAAAIEVLSSMDFVGVTERIDRDMPRLLTLLGRPWVPVVTRNVNRERPALDDLPSHVRSLLAERTKADREVYEWALARG